jgi:hypothetical protein
MTASESSQPPFELRCLTVLDGYAVREAAARTASAEWTGWLDRVSEIAGLAATELTTIHGWLIAQGLLRFEFNGRSVGLQYQLSPSGRDAVQRRSLLVVDDVRAIESAA